MVESIVFQFEQGEKNAEQVQCSNKKTIYSLFKFQLINNFEMSKR